MTKVGEAHGRGRRWGELGTDAERFATFKLEKVDDDLVDSVAPRGGEHLLVGAAQHRQMRSGRRRICFPPIVAIDLTPLSHRRLDRPYGRRRPRDALGGTLLDKELNCETPRLLELREGQPRAVRYPRAHVECAHHQRSATQLSNGLPDRLVGEGRTACHLEPVVPNVREGHGRRMGEIWGRCGGSMGEMWGDATHLEGVISLRTRRAPSPVGNRDCHWLANRAIKGDVNQGTAGGTVGERTLELALQRGVLGAPNELPHLHPRKLLHRRSQVEDGRGES